MFAKNEITQKDTIAMILNINVTNEPFLSNLPICERLFASSLWSESEMNFIYLVRGCFAGLASPMIHNGSSFVNGLISDKLTDTALGESLSFFFEVVD